MRVFETEGIPVKTLWISYSNSVATHERRKKS